LAVRTWDFTIPIERDGDAPVFLQISRRIAQSIERGALAPGAALPGQRELARSLGVHRNTVVAAYDELAAQGFVTTARARATLVADAWREPLPPSRHGARAKETACGFDVAPSLPQLPRPRTTWPAGTLVMQSGIPDARLFPTDELARAYRRALQRHGARLLAYGDERGHPRLRAALAAMLAARRGIPAGADDVVVVRGSQMGIDLCARLLSRPGDIVAVEELGYSPAWAALLHAGARLVPVPVDEGGLDVGFLEKLVASGVTLRAVYTTPHHQYPTTVTLSAPRRATLLQLCARNRVVILEDDFDHELQYEGRPVLPLAALDTQRVVVSIGTMSKVLAPGLRLGFVTGPRAVVDGVARLRRHVDRQGDQVLEEAVAELLEDGAILRHTRRMRRVYRTRRDVLVDALAPLTQLSFEVPRGGMALWVRSEVAPGVVEKRAAREGVGIATARAYALAPEAAARPYIRLGFAALDESELREAARRLQRALRTQA
jgi:GntR family transcriptional regulator / MocR family aminotransferase